MFLRILEYGSLGFFSVGTFIAKTSELPMPSWVESGGMIALVGFMVIQNYRQQITLGKVIAHKDDQLAAQNERMANLVASDIDSHKALTQALNLRPCMKDK